MNCVSFVEAKEKMRAGDADEQAHVCFFLQLLADRLPDEGYAPAVVLSVTLLAADIARNKDGFTGKPMPRSLTGLPPIMHWLLPDVVLLMSMKQFFPEDFAAEIAAAYKAVREKTGPHPVSKGGT